MAPPRYAVFGNPIAHSRSPWIHARFARETGEAILYEPRLAAPDGFAEALRSFREEGGAGCNVTVPFKEEAARLAQVRHPRAELAGAANTLWWVNGILHADNTDGVGLLRDLTGNLGVAVGGRRVLVLGAGGAARGAVPVLLEEGPAALVIANRTHERARRLVEAFRHLGPLEAVPLQTLEEGVPGPPFDIVINASAAGLHGGAPPLAPRLLRPGGCCYDMLYGPAARGFLHSPLAAEAGVRADGLGMLVEQAAESFAIWRGVRPRTAPVIEALRRELAAG